MAKIWVADTEPNERFGLYTRGNVGEVFAHVVTALTGTLIGAAVQRAQTEVFVELGALRQREAVGPSVGTGIFGGYLYMSGSAMRLFAVRMPGMTVGDADEQVFGEVADLPPYVRAKGDRNLLATLALCRGAARMFRRPDLRPLDVARQEAHAWLATMPDLSSAGDAELIAWVRGYPSRMGESMKRLLRSGMLVGAPRAILDRTLDRPGVPAGLANRIVGGAGDVDSAELARRLWAVGRLVAADASLTEAFDAGLDGIAGRTGDTALPSVVDAFLADHGHRGNDEYELAAPAWVMDPAPVYAAIDRLRHAPGHRDPVATRARLTADADAALTEALTYVRRPLRRLARRAALVSRQGSIGRERAKDVLVLENLGARRVLHELARRAAERGGPADVRDVFCVTFDELEAFLAEPAQLSDTIAARAAQQDDLNGRVPPAWFCGRIPDPSTWTSRADARSPAPAAGATLTGIAASGGRARGPARVVADPGDPRGLEPGEVLVCSITDPSWTPLFLAATAVVCDTGAVQSHAAIVARELGIPAVLSVNGITSVADGTIIDVDGTTGTVTISA